MTGSVTAQQESCGTLVVGGEGGDQQPISGLPPEQLAIIAAVGGLALLIAVVG